MTKEISVTKADTCRKPAGGSGAEAGSKLKTCATCGGRGQVLTSRGIFSIAQTCPHCKGAGRILEKPCKTCHGDGKQARSSKIRLKIPAGVEAGSRLRSQGNGEAGFRGGAAGDLYVVLFVKAHEIFKRDGDDLICEVPVSFVQAALGAEMEVPTLESRATIKIPAGTQPGTTFRVKGKGVKNLHGYGHGDLHVRPGGGARAFEWRTKNETPGTCRAVRRQGRPQHAGVFPDSEKVLPLEHLNATSPRPSANGQWQRGCPAPWTCRAIVRRTKADDS